MSVEIDPKANEIVMFIKEEGSPREGEAGIIYNQIADMKETGCVKDS